MSTEEEFTAFARASHLKLLRLACLLVLNRHDAEDLVQEALIRTFVSWNRIRERDRREAYVSRTLVRLVIDGRRRRRAIPVAEPPLALALEFGNEADRLADRWELFAAMRRLPAGQRECLVLRFFADLPVATVADMLECSVGTVKSQTSDGLANLRRHWRTNTGDRNDERHR